MPVTRPSSTYCFDSSERRFNFSLDTPCFSGLLISKDAEPVTGITSIKVARISEVACLKAREIGGVNII